jgi:hypothetical protein
VHDLRAGREQIGAVLGDRYVEHATLSPLDVLYRRADPSSRDVAGSAARAATARR